MNKNNWKKLCATILCLAMSLTFVACSEETTEVEIEETVVETQELTASVGGSQIVLPEELELPEVANSMVGMLVDDTYVGTLYISSYRSSTYVYINGTSLTVDGIFEITDTNGEELTTEYKDVKIALWEKGDNQAVYIDTVHFVADGTNQTYTFNNLTAGGEYRIAITYSDVGWYRACGNFRLSSVSATGSEEETAAEE